MMHGAQIVTFGGGGLERAAHLRGDAKRIARMLTAPGASAIVFWRGKILLEGSGQVSVVQLPLSDVVLEPAQEAPIFLGLDSLKPVFAVDISNWQPANETPVETGVFDGSEQVHPKLKPGQRFVDLREYMAGLSPLDAEMAASAKALFSWHASHRFCAKCGLESHVTMAGWQRDCPGCAAKHFPRTDPVVIMLITHGNNVLLGRSPGWPEGMYSLLAGFVEPGETLENAVRREVFEEVGVKVGQVGYLASQPWAFPSSLMVGCRGVALGTELNVDPVEIEDALWLSREQLMDVFAGLNPDIKPARRGSIAQFLLQNWLADKLD